MSPDSIQKLAFLNAFSSRILRQLFLLQKMGVSFGKSMNISKKIIEFIVKPTSHGSCLNCILLTSSPSLIANLAMDRLTPSQIVCELCYTKASYMVGDKNAPWVRALYIMAKYGCFLH